MPFDSDPDHENKNQQDSFMEEIDIPILPIVLDQFLRIVDIKIPQINLFQESAPTFRDADASPEPNFLRVRPGSKLEPGIEKRGDENRKLKYRPASTRSRMSRKYKEPKKGRKKGGNLGQQLVRNFAACPRCSYFLSGYRVLYGREVVESLEADVSDGWLCMQWTGETRKLLQRSYGIRTDVSYYFWEHACESCHRRIVFEERPEQTESGEQNERGPIFLDEDFFWVEFKSRS